MASIVYNPNNAQPESVSVKTGAYTIPAGYYAYVTAHCDGGQTFSIGGIEALRSIPAVVGSGLAGSVSSIDVETTGTTTASYTVPTGTKAVFHLYYYASGTNDNVFVTGTVTSNVQIGNFSRTVTALSVPAQDSGSAGGFFSGGSFANSSYTWNTGGGEVISMSVATSNMTTVSTTKNIMGYTERPNGAYSNTSGTTAVGNYWVSSGTELTTDGRFTVALYPIVS